MAKCDEARPILNLEAETGATHMGCLLELLHSYRRKESRPASREISIAMKMEAEEDHGSSGNSEDVVIKIIRVIANMSINSEVGSQVAAMPEIYCAIVKLYLYIFVASTSRGPNQIVHTPPLKIDPKCTSKGYIRYPLLIHF